MTTADTVLILTPMKDARPFLDVYFRNLLDLAYPRDCLHLGILEGDSVDGTFADLQRRSPELRHAFATMGVWKRDFGYRIPAERPRWWPSLQPMRRSVLARSRNHLLFRALSDQDWVLWLDVDVVEYPSDIVSRLLAARKNILHPNCVLTYGGRSFDENAWRGPQHTLLSDMRREGDLVRLDSVGGTMLLVRADIHRDGLIFPPFPYPAGKRPVPPDMIGMETEGLGLMAMDMGHQCWGMPNLEIRHAPS